jgi:putative transposase
VDQRAAERSYGVAGADLTPTLSWSKVSFINAVNAWNDGRAPDAPVSHDEAGNLVCGLPWRGAVSADVFRGRSTTSHECTFVSTDDRWVWDHGNVIKDEMR